MSITAQWIAEATVNMIHRNLEDWAVTVDKDGNRSVQAHNDTITIGDGTEVVLDRISDIHLPVRPEDMKESEDAFVAQYLVPFGMILASRIMGDVRSAGEGAVLVTAPQAVGDDGAFEYRDGVAVRTRITDNGVAADVLYGIAA